jgi:hypothetical protein
MTNLKPYLDTRDNTIKYPFELEMIPCPVCMKDMPKGNMACSLKCGNEFVKAYGNLELK